MDMMTTGTTGPTGPTGTTGILPISLKCGGPNQPKCTMYWWQIAVYVLSAVLAIILIGFVTYMIVQNVSGSSNTSHRAMRSAYSGNSCSSWM